MRRAILQLGDPRLWESSVAVADPRAAAGLIRDLSDTLAEFRAQAGFGRGIAAPQIGAMQRVIFLRMPDGFTGALCNPRLTWASPERFERWDDCFSFPDLMVWVSRARAVRVDYQDEEGRPQQLAAAGDLAELLQHEIDHLDGVLAVDRAASPRALATRSEWQRACLAARTTG